MARTTLVSPTCVRCLDNLIQTCSVFSAESCSAKRVTQKLLSSDKKGWKELKMNSEALGYRVWETTNVRSNVRRAEVGG
jgi:hypothetical protein